MRLSLTVPIAFVFLGSLAFAQDDSEKLADASKMINALASENPAPKERRGPDLKFPPEYDRKKQQSVYAAISDLKALGPQAFRPLIEKWSDERYSLTYSVGINGYMNNATVGKMCRIIVYDQIQPYGIWPETDDDPRGKPKRPSYPSTFLADANDASKWFDEHKDKSLFEIQLMVVDWVIAQEDKSPHDFTAKELEAMRTVRTKLLETQKPITRGNYYMDDYY